MSLYYLSLSGQEQGPFDATAVRSLIQRGLRRDVLVRGADSSTWALLREHPGFKDSFQQVESAATVASTPADIEGAPRALTESFQSAPTAFAARAQRSYASGDSGDRNGSGEFAPFEPGTRVASRYLIERVLGEGTFGWVFLAADSSSGQRVAIKVLKAEHAGSEAIVGRFKRRELEILQRIQSGDPAPNVVKAVETSILENDGLLCLVLEFVEGPSLTDVIAKERVMAVDDVHHVALGLARGLAAIHAVQGVHRDMKPDNIRLRDGTEPVILDLGIARAMWETSQFTATGQSLMTPYYASPEQLMGGQVGPPADVYALGLIINEMLTGFVPLAGKTHGEMIALRTTRAAPDPRLTRQSVPDYLAELVLHCLATDPDKRPTAQELVNALADGEKLSSNGTSRKKIVVGAVVLALASAVAVALVVSGVGTSDDLDTPSATGSARSRKIVAASATAVVTGFPMTIEVGKSQNDWGKEELKISLKGQIPSYVLLIDRDPSGGGTTLLPNPSRKSPMLTLESATTFPSIAESNMGLRFKPKNTGAHVLIAIAVEDRKTYEELVPPDARTKAFSPLTAADIERITTQAKSATGRTAHAEGTHEVLP